MGDALVKELDGPPLKKFVMAPRLKEDLAKCELREIPVLCVNQGALAKHHTAADTSTWTPELHPASPGGMILSAEWARSPLPL